MLIRALMISVLLHLAILLTASEILFPSFLDAAPLAHENSLRLTLSEYVRDGVPLAVSNAAALSTPTLIAMERETDFRRPLKPETSVFRPFSRLTVENQKSDSRAANPDPYDSSSEMPPVSLEVVKTYQLSVARLARRFKNYPALARESGMEGTVTVILAIPAGAEPVMVSLGNSSGYEVLDRQALDMLDQAVRFVPLPETLRGRRMSFSLPIEYRLVE